MSLEGFKPIPNDKFGSLVSRVNASAVPYTSSQLARNVRFKAKGVKTRNGLSQTMRLGTDNMRVVGGGLLALPNSDINYPLMIGANLANSQYELFREYPEGTGLMVPIVNLGANIAGDNLYADFAFAYNKAFFTVRNFANGDGLASNWSQFLRYDGTGIPYQVGLYDVFYTPPVLAVGAAGNIDAGTRWCIVLFETNSGYIGGATLATAASVTLAGGTMLNLTGIPTYPVYPTVPHAGDVVTKRIVCFSTAGADVNGPYYYIPEAQVIDGDTMTKTVIDDNTTTTLTVNFTDEFLQGSSSISSPVDFFDKIGIQPNSIFYSPTNRRMVCCGNGTSDRTTFYLSEPDDPETFLGSTGLINPNQNNGETAVCAREYKSQLFLFKETAGFIAYNDAADPVDWTVEKRWDRVGPVGPWAVDTSEEFMIILDQSGVYMVDGTVPQCISDEISSVDSDVWAQINWRVKSKFWVFIDTDLNEIHVGVAIGGATEVSTILKCNYLLGLTAGNRKWSLDTVPSTKMLRMQRELPSGTDPRIASSQILHLSSNYDSMINLVDPLSHNDNGNGIDSRYRTGFYEENGEMQIGGVGLDMVGQGTVIISMQKYSDDLVTLPRSLVLSPYVRSEIIKARGTSPRFAIDVWNNNQSGNWFEIIDMDLYVRTQFKTRRLGKNV